MTKVLLEIGARGPLFVKTLSKRNPQWEFTYLYSALHTTHIVEHGVRGVSARLDNFGVPDNSLNVLVSNHAIPPRYMEAFEKELLRTLKVGGMFFEARCYGHHLSFKTKALNTSPFTTKEHHTCHLDVPFFLIGTLPLCESYLTIETVQQRSFIYPATSDILNRLRVLRLAALDAKLPDELRPLSFNPPSLRIWIRTSNT